MGRSKLIILFVWVSVFCLGSHALPAGAADPNYSQKIVSFYEDVAWEEIQQYVEEWRAHGVSIIMELPMFNCLILKVPGNITASDLAADPRVERVENDQKIEIQGNVNAQYASFIEPVPTPPSGHYPWSILKLYDQYYDPWLLSSVYEKQNLPFPIWLALSRLKAHKIRIAVFDTGIHYYHRNLFKVVKGGIDLVNKDTTPKGKIKFRRNIPLDDNGHGTYVAGIICAALDKHGKWGRHARIELYAVKILNYIAMGDLSNIIMGLQWAIDHQMDIVNMSIGYQQDSPAIRRAVRIAHELGIVMVASVGNHSNWDDTIILAVDGGAADGGAADGGAADGGAADGGAADGGAADGGAADGGAADGGAADGGAADGGAADGGAADGGAADGGAADGGAADGGAADGGAADGGAADGVYGPLPIFSVMYPARYPKVIAVGASTPFGELASYSNYGPEMDVIAPGSAIISADITNGNSYNGYGFCSGTSQAAAHVTAAVALMLSVNPSLGPEVLKDILTETATLTSSELIGEISLISALERIIREDEITQTFDTQRFVFDKNKYRFLKTNTDEEFEGDGGRFFHFGRRRFKSTFH
ncbi:MAG: S8 family serine peptidase [Deltaproteobacteria bacterium]|nr:MAG: S8 family serine peptidase [Deltaproteobacteria bacterium]